VLFVELAQQQHQYHILLKHSTPSVAGWGVQLCLLQAALAATANMLSLPSVVLVLLLLLPLLPLLPLLLSSSCRSTQLAPTS
jgi:hypothetical protein